MYLKIPPCGCEILEVGWEIGTLDIVGALLTKASLKKWICAASNLNARIPSRLIRQMLANFFWSWILKECFKVQEKKILFPSSTKREIRQFHVVVVQRRQRNVQKSVMHVQSSCLAGLNLSLFCRSRCVSENCKEISKRIFRFMREPRNGRKIWILDYCPKDFCLW